MSLREKNLYEFEEFRFDPRKRLLWRRGELVPLQPKATAVLALLLEDRGSLLERQEIIDKVWSDAFVEEGNLNHAVSALRKVLGTHIIQTVPRRGYRFTAAVAEIPSGIEREVLLETRTVSTTVIQEHHEIDPGPTYVGARPSEPSFGVRRRYLIYAAVQTIISPSNLIAPRLSLSGYWSFPQGRSVRTFSWSGSTGQPGDMTRPSSTR